MESRCTIGPVFATELAQEKLNVAISVGSLYPILPQQTGSPKYLPQQWAAYTHPEGQVYFVRDGSIRVVTDSYLYKSEIADKIVSWVQHIEKEAESKAFTFPDSIELYVQLEEEDCNYYFADHAARTLFWLEDYDTTELGLLPVVSPSHLKIQLEEQYWGHVECHCMHGITFQNNIVDEAISQLVHACGDQMTSSSSTFPYSFKECKDFLDILTPARQRANDGHIITLVARIFNVVANNRYWTHYGQEQARLSRDTSILEETSGQTAWGSSIASAVSLRVSDFFASRLDTIFTDDYVYVMDWQKFMTQALGKWRGAFVQSLALLMLHIFCFFLPVSRTLAIVSAGFLSSSILISAILIHYHQDLETGSAGEAYEYLSRNKTKKCRFQGLALLFSLPQAFSLWGLFLMFSQVATFIPSSYLALSSSGIILSSIVFYICSSIFSAVASRVSGLFARNAPPSSVSDKESAV
ncbi:hypothetical protein EST38_g9372 [Candolleomyces aberdarensis]|uniref:Uncharacterized protein n=1 Tax=Candolleomyces aberdarensis TaxID=2316362 RepID=A0A4Q2DBU2_9AGAR|nr:hypothetical protein EST38_g9372 [Candolleomyces aberdarensis]